VSLRLLYLIFLQLLDLVPALRAAHAPAGVTASGRAGEPANPGKRQAEHPASRFRAGLGLGVPLTTVGAAASFTMGANDVPSATGSLVGTGTFTPLLAGIVGGAGLATGVLTWGRPLLHKVAFDIVTLDRPMATAAQLIQAAVVLGAVSIGLFTSMNQALVGAMGPVPGWLGDATPSKPPASTASCAVGSSVPPQGSPPGYLIALAVLHT
jgi:Phosphate transporter family